MTFVAAKRFGERVLVASDTMISDLTGTGHDVIPGRLKVIILDSEATIAYAGLANQSVDTIRRVKQILADGGSVSDAEQFLAAATTEYEGQVEFLLVSHRDGVTLKRIWDGNISSNYCQACIGQRDLLTALLKREREAPQSLVPHDFEDEAPFSFGFMKLFNGLQVSDSVGGFGIMATCSPFGHCYNPFAGTSTWDVIPGGLDVTEQQLANRLANRLSGMTQWGYNIAPPKLRGVGVIGAIILDAGVGYIYSPLDNDKPVAFKFQRPTEINQQGPILEAFQKQIDEVALTVGGGVEVISPPQYNRMPTETEFEQIASHAIAAAFPTHVAIEPEGVSIRCEAGSNTRIIRVGYTSLGNDPARILTIAINRLNAEMTAQLHRNLAN